MIPIDQKCLYIQSMDKLIRKVLYLSVIVWFSHPKKMVTNWHTVDIPHKIRIIFMHFFLPSLRRDTRKPPRNVPKVPVTKTWTPMLKKM